MKSNFLHKLILLVSFIGILFSCEDKETDPKINSDAVTNVKIENPISGEYTVTAENLSKLFYTFNLSQADFGTPTQIQYGLEIGIDGFDINQKFESLANSSTTPNIEVTYQQLNTALGRLKLEPNVAQKVIIRAVANINPSNPRINKSVSQTYLITVTPFKLNPDDLFPKIYVPGGYGGSAGYEDWEPSNTAALYSKNSDNNYTGFIWIREGVSKEFKFTPTNVGFDNDKGDDGTRTGKLIVDNEVNIISPSEGTLFLKVNWISNTYSIASANIGIVGEATPTGWDGPDTKFVYNPSTKKYEINSIVLKAGVFKFRADNKWDLKLQPESTDVNIVLGQEIQTFNSANGEVSNDPNYKINEFGNYKIILDLHNSGFYNFVITKI